MTLGDYLSGLRGIDKFQKIILVAAQLVEILKYVHAAGRTHNDLKPENVMINLRLDKHPKVCLIDFGFVNKFYKNNQLEHFDEGELVDTF